ncbi:MAG: mevalonate kinase [Thermoflexales bacterium]|nr:mevalonate kinase [Thermoflexales bacterium]
MIASSAPGKIILLGEHAVVYGQPALAAPVTQARAEARVRLAPRGSGCTIRATDMGRTLRLAQAAGDEPLAAAVRGTLAHVQATEPDVTITIHSTIPIAGGLGSGAAVSTALVRALAAHLGHALDDEAVSALVFEVEKLYHGTPSGIDNSVVVYARPVYFVKGQPIETFLIGRPFSLAIGDTGIPSPTHLAVGEVRAAWQADPERYERQFRHMGSTVRMARSAIERGDLNALGAFMDSNHALLQELGVSCAALDSLVAVARHAGALGAKLSGGGRGGNAIALMPPDDPKLHKRVKEAWLEAGAKNVIITGMESYG